MQDLSGFDSKDHRGLKASRSTVVEGPQSRASMTASPEAGPLKRGILSLPGHKSSKASLRRQQDALHEVDIDEEQVSFKPEACCACTERKSLCKKEITWDPGTKTLQRLGHPFLSSYPLSQLTIN